MLSNPAWYHKELRSLKKAPLHANQDEVDDVQELHLAIQKLRDARNENTHMVRERTFDRLLRAKPDNVPKIVMALLVRYEQLLREQSKKERAGREASIVRSESVLNGP